MDGTDKIAADETDLLSDAAVARLRSHPRFRDAVESLAASALTEYEAYEPATRWLNRDLGRSALALTALILDGAPGGLTFAGLVQVATLRQVCSRGRALAYVQYALSSRRMELAEGVEPWARRRLVLTPAFLDPLRTRMISSLRAVALVAPEITEDLPRLTSDAALRQAAISTGALLAMRPELNRNPGGPLRQVFLARDAGMRLLHHLILRQARDRSRLLEAAPVSRAELSRRYGVSRTHVNRLLAEAEASGALRIAAIGRVVFSPAFSDEAEAYFAGMIQVHRTVVRMMPAVAAPELQLR